ncbi:MAG: hypothetical protein IPH68_09835 [Chitinophagaceae bacterium]|nr:hypothetical protein [Chitinophagaceae bacterium]
MKTFISKSIVLVALAAALFLFQQNPLSSLPAAKDLRSCLTGKLYFKVLARH